ncbi:putative phage abortive infection protein [Pseudomonas syringae]|uniref:putative phage abortive infection protein n=1 Tax=Pseudomonas syringae TaxID=317 RepID=UPI003F751972
MALVLIGVPGVYVLYFAFLYHGLTHLAKEEDALVGVRAGTFGDAFGTLNALFSGMAFAGVMITLLLQRRDLAASHDQNSKQQAESQFYNMLTLQQQVVQGFDLHRKGNDAHTIQGRDCFRDWHTKLRARYSELYISARETPDIVRGLDAYEIVLRSNQGDLGLYFRSLYSIFRYLDNVEGAQKKHLGNVARSLLSDYELVLLFYNCLSKKGRKFNRYAVEYALFDNLDVQLLLSEEHVAHIEKTALGDNKEALIVRATVVGI